MTTPVLSESSYTSSTFAMGVLTLLVLVLASWGFEWQSYSLRASSGYPTLSRGAPGADSRARALLSPSGRTTGRLSLLPAVYLLTVLGFLAGTIATVTGALTVRSFLVALGGVLACYLLLGVYVSENIRLHLTEAGYRLKRTVLFRRRPVWSMLVGWATILVLLTIAGTVVLGLWTIAGGNGPLFVAVVVALGTVVVLYAVASVGVSLGPTESTVPFGRSSDRTTEGATSRTGGDFTTSGPFPRGGSARVTLRRLLPMVRGWVGVALLLVTGAGSMAVVWMVTDGGGTFLAALFVISVLLGGYVLTSSR